jgi:hypothetical protein
MNRHVNSTPHLPPATGAGETEQLAADSATTKAASDLKGIDGTFEALMAEIDEAAAELRRTARPIFFRPLDAEPKAADQPAPAAEVEVMERPDSARPNKEIPAGALKSIEGDSGPVEARSPTPTPMSGPS